MQLAAEKRAEILLIAKDIARRMAQKQGEVTADDVQRRLILWDYDLSDLGNAAGSIFKGKEWECVGWKKSERVSNHARAIRVWRLRQS